MSEENVQVNHGLSNKLSSAPGKGLIGLGSVITFGIAMAMIVMGALYLNRCPAERLIPIYLIVAGSFSLLSIVLAMLGKCCVNEEGKAPIPVKVLTFLVGLFIFAWFIAGNVWIYGLHGRYSTDASMPNYCNDSFYLFAFWITTLSYILIGVVMILFCCVCCCTMCCIAAN